MSNVVRDPDCPNPAFARLVSVRQYEDRKVQWVCIHCRVADKAIAVIQPVCQLCGRLMHRVKEP